MTDGRRFAESLVGAVAIALAACGSQSPATVSAPTAQADSNRAEAERLVSTLAAGDAGAAEQRFSARLRAELPPSVLGGVWRSLLARNGAFQSFSVVTKDHAYGKERYKLSVTFKVRTLQALVVFEPASGEVVGLFFSMPTQEHPAISAPAVTPINHHVDELALTIGEVPTVLGASLTLPAERGEARLPAVLLVPGSGPQDRDETLQRAKPFRDLALGLAERGIVALRYDKRTFTYPKLFDSRHATVEEEVVADAALAAGVLRTRPEVDPRRLVILGHSLGALLAPEIAQRSGGAAGLVLIAAPGRPVPDLVLEQMRLSGATAADLAGLKKKVQALPQLPPDELVLGLPARYWNDLASRDEMAIARELDAPILYLRGELDRNVFPLDQDRWRRALQPHAQLETITLPGLNHLLVPAKADLAGDAHVAEEAIRRIADFVAHVGPT